MNVILAGGALATLVTGLTVFLLLRACCSSARACGESERADLTWKHYRPFQRLLDPADFQYLRDRGISESRVRKLRAERRKIYRLCLRHLARDFNRVYRTLNQVLFQSEVDRPDLAAEVTRQRITFYQNLLWAEVRLTLHACGADRMPELDLTAPLEALQNHLGALSIQAAPTSA